MPRKNRKKQKTSTQENVRAKSSGIYFCPVITLFLNNLTDLIEAVVKPHPDLYKKYEERRGKFLEEEIYQLFHQAFPSARIYRGSEWFDPATKKSFDNDLLVVMNIEGKTNCKQLNTDD